MRGNIGVIGRKRIFNSQGESGTKCTLGWLFRDFRESYCKLQFKVRAFRNIIESQVEVSEG